MSRRMMVWAVAGLAAGSAAAQEPPNPSFYLLNRSPVTIRRVFASPAGQTDWGRNRLDNATVEPGGYFPIRLPADGNCVYDIRVIWINGHAEERRDLDVCDLDKLSFADAGARPPAETSFRLVNRSRLPVSELYLSVSSDESWGEDRLGDDSVPGGATKVIRVPAGECVYDLRVVFANGEAREKRRLNLCQISSLRVP